MRKSVRLAQNFLHNPGLVTQLVDRSSIGTEDTALDIGAGGGSITRALAVQAKHVIAYESDERLAAKLAADFITQPRVEVIAGDFLTSTLPVGPYKVFANIPFNITSDVVRRLLGSLNPPEDSYLILQREAALKFAGASGRQTLFSILHAPWFTFDVVHTFQRSDFTPQPQVAIVLLRITRRSPALVRASDAASYRDFVSYIFNHANPNISQSLPQLFQVKAVEHLSAIGVDTNAKPSQLSPESWLDLFHTFGQTASLTQLHRINGTAAKLSQESANIEKHHRTRSAKNWRTS